MFPRKKPCLSFEPNSQQNMDNGENGHLIQEQNPGDENGQHLIQEQNQGDENGSNPIINQEDLDRNHDVNNIEAVPGPSINPGMNANEASQNVVIVSEEVARSLEICANNCNGQLVATVNANALNTKKRPHEATEEIPEPSALEIELAKPIPRREAPPRLDCPQVQEAKAPSTSKEIIAPVPPLLNKNGQYCINISERNWKYTSGPNGILYESDSEEYSSSSSVVSDSNSSIDDVPPLYLYSPRQFRVANSADSTGSELPNSIPTNTIPGNSIPVNSIATNSISANSIPANSIPPNFIPPNFIPQNFIPPNFAPQNFIAPNFVPQNFVPPNPMPANLVPINPIRLPNEGQGDNIWDLDTVQESEISSTTPEE